jgi:hypothetical protein
MKKGSPLIREIYLTYLEYKQPNVSLEYKSFCEDYVSLIISEQPQNEHENYYKYWDTLKNYEKRVTKTKDKF